MRAVIGFIGIGLLVVGCSTHGDNQSAPPTTSSTTTTTTTTTTSPPPPPPPANADAAVAKDALLKRSELGDIIGDTDVRQLGTLTKNAQSSDGVEPRECAMRLLFQGAPGAVGEIVIVGDSNRGARGQTASQLIVVYPSRDRGTEGLEPAGIVANLARNLGYCADGTAFTTTAKDVTQNWVAGPVTANPSDVLTDPTKTATRAGGGAQRQSTPARSCYHAVAARANTVVESIVCSDGDAAAQANKIIDQISTKLPPN